MRNLTRDEALKLINEVRSVIEKNIDLVKYLDEIYLGDSVEQTDLETYCQGVSNGFLSEIVHAVTGYEIEVAGDVEELFPCPCCGFKTLTELYDVSEGTGYDICPYCKWEDDGTTEINVYRSINRGTIEDYHNNIQANFNKYYINKR